MIFLLWSNSKKKIIDVCLLEKTPRKYMIKLICYNYIRLFVKISILFIFSNKYLIDRKKNNNKDKRNSPMVIKDDIYKKIVEKFLHHLSGKCHVSNLIIELNHPIEQLKQSNDEIEGFLMLYRSVLIEKSNTPSNLDKITPIFKEKQTLLINNNFLEFTKCKVILLFLLYDVVDDKTTIILNEDHVIFGNIAQNKIQEIEILLLKEWRFMFKNKINFLYNYKKTDNTITFLLI